MIALIESEDFVVPLITVQGKPKLKKIVCLPVRRFLFFVCIQKLT